MTAMLFARRQFVASALLASVAGCATPIAGRGRSAIPFLTANATKIGDAYRIAWEAEGVRHVTIHAGPKPSPILTGVAFGRGAGSGGVMIHDPLIPRGQRPYFTLVPDKGAPLVIADRALHLSSIPNLRDIGGYRTTDGRWVKMGLLYRSDQLDRVSDANLEALNRLNLRFVADLRTRSERSREPDRLPRGIQSLILDVAADSEGSLGGDMRKAMSAISTGKGVELLTAANRDFVSLDSARKAYATLLQRLAEPDNAPFLYHCTAGKDRTGWATAVILTMLGVPRETVMADYLASNSFLERKNAATLEALGKSRGAVDPAYLLPVLTVRADYLNAAFAEVEKRFGTFEDYLRKGLNMSRYMIKYLRNRYTE